MRRGRENVAAKIKPIETRYNGYRFRSRLEARWAVFFDTLGIKYEYEKEGYDLGKAGYYLPDFWLPQVHMWAEVKPVELTEEEHEKCDALVILSECPCLMLIGMPEDKPYWARCPNIAYECEEDGLTITNIKSVYITDEDFCLTNYHGYVTDEHRFYSQPDGEEDSHWEDTRAAAFAARSARFEFGNR